LTEEATLFVNQKIQVLKKEGRDWFISSIQDIRGGVISIAIPYLGERPLILRAGDEIKVRFTMENCSYIFDTKVIGEATDNIKLYRLAYPEAIDRVQQRMHVRLPVMLDVEYTVPGRDPKKTSLKAVTVDLSGGGAKLAVRERINENTRLLLKFTLPLRSRPEPLELEALVVRSMKVEPERELYHLGVKFINTTRHQEDLIVRFVFEKMAQQKRLR